jgi:hypothetical protein
MSEQMFSQAQEAVVVSAFRNGIPVDAIAAVVGRTVHCVELILRKVGLNNVHQKGACAEPDEEPDDDAAGGGPVQSCIAGDLAFQQAMHRAIQRGLEKPPLIGVFKNNTPLDFRCHYSPAQLHSSCSSPARDCAELGDAKGVM